MRTYINNAKYILFVWIYASYYKPFSEHVTLLQLYCIQSGNEEETWHDNMITSVMI
jgi:hypothetical protein